MSMAAPSCTCDSFARELGGCPVHGTRETRDELERLRAQVSRSSGVDAKAVAEIAEELEGWAEEGSPVPPKRLRELASALSSALAGEGEAMQLRKEP